MSHETMGKHAVTVRIAGEEHAIRSEAEPDYTRSCAQFVDDAISEVKENVNLIETHKAVILAALSITDQLFQARGELERVSQELVGRLDTLRRRIEEALDRPLA